MFFIDGNNDIGNLKPHSNAIIKAHFLGKPFLSRRDNGKNFLPKKLSYCPFLYFKEQEYSI
jgi:hypothetical protein